MMLSLVHEGHEGEAESRHISYKRTMSFFYPFFIIIWPFAAPIILNQPWQADLFPANVQVNTEGNVGLESIEFQDMMLLKFDKIENELKDGKMNSFDLNKKIIHLEHEFARYKSTMNDIVESKDKSYLQDQMIPSQKISSLETLNEQGDNGISQKTLSHIPSSLARRRESKTALQDEVSIHTPLTNRSLHQVKGQSDQLMDICNAGTNLSPLNRANSFQFDEKIRDILAMVNSISSPDSLLQIETPQYKAACWLIFQQVDEIIVDDYLIQSYVVLVFIFSTALLREDSAKRLTEALPDRVCLSSAVVCDNKSHIIEFDLDKSDLTFAGTIPSELSYLNTLRVMRFGNVDLTGTIPPELGRLQNLKEITFSNTWLSGPIPSEIGRMKLLEVLQLDRNNFTGILPSTISHCEKLRRLDVSQNKLSGPLHIGILDTIVLKEAWFSMNAFDGSIPPFLNTNIASLRLDNNNFEGEVPPDLWYSRSLSELWLNDNNLNGTFPENVKNLYSISSFGLSSNSFTGTIPDIFGNFTNLEKVIFSSNSLTGPIPPSIFKEGMIRIDLSDNELSGTVPLTFCDQEGLTLITIDDSPWFNDKPKVECKCCSKHNCYISRIADISLGGLRRATCLDSNIYTINFDEGYTVNDLVANETLSEILGVNVSGTEDICISPTGCYSISETNKEQDFFSLKYSSSSTGLTNQETCDAVQVCGHSIGQYHTRRKGMNRLTQLLASSLDVVFKDTQSPEYKAMCWLVTEDDKYSEYEVCDGTLLQRYVMAVFYFSQEDTFDFDKFSSHSTCDWPGVKCDELGDRFIEGLSFDNDTISEMSSDETLGVKNVKLSGPLMWELGRLSRLKSFSINGNSFTGTIDPFMFSNVPELEIFQANHNHFEGEFPIAVLYSQKIREIDMGNNILQGTLMDNALYSPDLEKFIIEDNLMFGSIPVGFSICKNLTSFRLGKNTFTGRIPDFVGELQHLTEIQLNENNLEGSIPVFKSKGLEKIFFHSNHFTGTIPSEISTLQHLKLLILHHNSLQGAIPSELSNLKFIEIVQFHNNRLTGAAPIIEVSGIGLDAYISDCKVNSGTKCMSCTMCCDPDDSDNKCRANWSSPIIVIPVYGLPIILPIILIIAIHIKLIYGRVHRKHWLIDDRDPLLIYKDYSVYSFVFLDSSQIAAHSMHIFITILQLSMFVIFILASDPNNPQSDWEFTIKCTENSLMCKEKKLRRVGWVLTILLLFIHLGVDIINGLLQIRKAIGLFDIKLLISGFRLLFLAFLALATSIIYNTVIAETNTDMVINSVVLMFINDLDEKAMEIMETFAPKWTEHRIAEVKRIMSDKVPLQEVIQKEIESENSYE